MLSDTLVDGLSSYRIGPKVRALRLKKKMGLVQLGEHTGLSPAMLSKIERAQLFPTLPTLLRIAMVFGVGLEHFFARTEDRPEVSVTRRDDRIRLPDKPDSRRPSYLFESLDFPATERRMDAYLVTFPPDGPASEPHLHEGAEFIYVLSGTMVISVEGQESVLEEGDTAYFESAAAHSYRAASQ